VPGDHSGSRRLSEWSVIVLGIAISLVLALFLVGAVLGSVTDHDTSSPTSAVNVSTAARRFVTERALKGRTQVEFPAQEDDEIVPLGGRRFQVVSYVDAPIRCLRPASERISRCCCGTTMWLAGWPRD
jgi:hypothetical protein